MQAQIGEITIDLDELTIDEIEALEDITDMPFDEVFHKGKKKAKLMRAIAYIAKRREDPEFTIEQAGALKVVVKSEKVDPTDADA